MSVNLKKALVVGINNYGNPCNNLSCCVNDANDIARLLEFNDDGSRNLSVIRILDEEATYDNIMKNLDLVFKEDTDIGVFYFSGHGYDDKYDGRICTYDYNKCHMGIKFRDLIETIEKSKCKNKIVILDCCHSGKIGNFTMIGDNTILCRGTTILTACNTSECSIEYDGHGLFTKLLIEALLGGASDIFGRVTPGSIYSYIDSSLGSFDQRPLFKSHVETFVTLRNAKQKMTITEMRFLINLFDNVNFKFQLDSSYEPKNFPGSKEIGEKDLREPYYNPINGEKFAILQKAVSNALVKPTVQKHMFYAALYSDTCELTETGKHYWWLVNNKVI